MKLFYSVSYVKGLARTPFLMVDSQRNWEHVFSHPTKYRVASSKQYHFIGEWHWTSLRCPSYMGWMMFHLQRERNMVSSARTKQLIVLPLLNKISKVSTIEEESMSIKNYLWRRNYHVSFAPSVPKLFCLRTCIMCTKTNPVVCEYFSTSCSVILLKTFSNI